MFFFSKMRYKFAVKEWLEIKDLKNLTRVLESKRFTQTLEPLKSDGPQGKTILILAPHPDDEILGVGGTLIKMLGKNKKIKIIIVSNGEKTMIKNALPGESVREKESQKVAKKLGLDIEFWGFPQGKIKTDKSVKKNIENTISNFKPDTLFLPFFADDHPDHRLANFALFKALHGNPQNIEVWAYQIYSTCFPNVLVDISKEMKTKISLIRQFKSQAYRRDWAHYACGLNALNSRYLKTNTKRYVETFFVLPLKDYLEVLGQYFSGLNCFNKY